MNRLRRCELVQRMTQTFWSRWTSGYLNHLQSRPKWYKCNQTFKGKCDEWSDCTLVHLVHSEEESISTELRRFWEIESLGILDKGSVTLGNGDEEILSDKSVNFVDSRYRVNLPWKPCMREPLQNNKTVARKRFEGLVYRSKCDHELFCEYKDVIDDYVREGIVERTSCDSLLDSQGFYLPHHAVIRSDKTTSRIRIVFDGSAHEDGQSSSIYVDDLICGQDDVPDALRTTLECLQIFSDAGMLLRKWRSNSKQLNLLWQQGVKTESSETSAIDLRPPTKVLGLAWDPENDLIYFDPKDLLKFVT
ncbi:integrase catalytic domain-containing protein [Trichonephila clavipes]|uniref:Integrase catalytic domain-containing protein n=1 Tax=Trichonephila clavipes TaxID=2585209 RepID=A0A8X6V1U4_TRICX|nr:integrase catalytic domain-containing protein [Trichonephila clavipes]